MRAQKSCLQRSAHEYNIQDHLWTQSALKFSSSAQRDFQALCSQRQLELAFSEAAVGILRSALLQPCSWDGLLSELLRHPTDVN